MWSLFEVCNVFFKCMVPFEDIAFCLYALWLLVLNLLALCLLALHCTFLCLLGLLWVMPTWAIATCVMLLSIKCLVCYTYLPYTSLLYAYFSYASLHFASLHYDYSPLEFFSNCWPPVNGLVFDVSITHLAKCLFKSLYCRVCGLSMEMTRGTPRNLLPLL